MVKRKKKTIAQKFELLTTQFTDWVGTTNSIIAHTVFFIGIFALRLIDFSLDSILLILTTAVSLEAIYLAIFIQMTVNKNTRSLLEVEADIDEIQEDVEDLGEEFEELSEDVEEIGEDIEEIQEDDRQDDIIDTKTRQSLDKIESQLQILVKEIENLKKTA